MAKGIYVAFDRDGIPRYVGMAFRDVHRRARHVNCIWCSNRKLREFVAAHAPLSVHVRDLSTWDDRSIRLGEARLIVQFGRIDLGTGPLLNGNDGEFGPYRYDPAIRSAAAHKAARARKRRLRHQGAQSKTSEQQSKATQAAWATIRARKQAIEVPRR